MFVHLRLDLYTLNIYDPAAHLSVGFALFFQTSFRIRKTSLLLFVALLCFQLPCFLCTFSGHLFQTVFPHFLLVPLFFLSLQPRPFCPCTNDSFSFRFFLRRFQLLHLQSQFLLLRNLFLRLYQFFHLDFLAFR